MNKIIWAAYPERMLKIKEREREIVMNDTDLRNILTHIMFKIEGLRSDIKAMRFTHIYYAILISLLCGYMCYKC